MNTHPLPSSTKKQRRYLWQLKELLQDPSDWNIEGMNVVEASAQIQAAKRLLEEQRETERYEQRYERS